MAVLFVAMATPPMTVAAPGIESQEFVITAYYSPLPDQCCYVRGTYAADTLLNGMGIAGADGTAVYPGMIAAPKSYAFGTRIELPGIGIGTVHDRGGAINVLESGAHRLDLWMGYGEEGLARALAFGVQRVKGTVYPLGGIQPQESFVLDTFSASLGMIKPYLRDEPDLLALQPELGEKSVGVELLQKHLIELGYLQESVSGWFGPATETALRNFMHDASLDQPTDRLTTISAAYLVAAKERLKITEPIAGIVERGSPPAEIISAKRTLRFLGFYKGRTNGEYNDALYNAVLAFQQSQQLVGNATQAEPGAGRIGPMTKTALLKRWSAKHVAKRAEKLLLAHAIEQKLEEKNEVIMEFLAEGDKGSEVRKLQNLLSERGYFPTDRISGLFGVVTRDAVIAYQLDRKLIEKVSDKGTGFVGPATIAMLKREQKLKLLRLVRAEGWDSL